ncbi:MAG: M3 family oligoendopeptidase [Holosporales bacterium]|jgi:oligoendopeptidase F|nr:M3 family oligoendopeptidase [Holosporales bacterium]
MAIEKLTWDLGAVKSSEADVKNLRTVVARFCKKYSSGKLSISNLDKAIASYEDIYTAMSKIMTYAFLDLQTDLQNHEKQKFFQKMSEMNTAISADVVFFTVDMLNFELKDIQKELKDSAYLPWIENSFRFKEHMLSHEGEKVMTMKSLSGASAWCSLYDELMARIEFDFNGTPKTLTEICSIAAEDDDKDNRKAASIALGKGLKENEFFVKSIYNNLVLDWSIDSSLGKYKTPEEGRHVSNNIDKKAVDHMLKAATDAFSKVTHRFYKTKAKLLGQDKLDYWDRAVIVKKTGFLDRHFTYEESSSVVLGAFKEFSPIFYEIAKEFIEKGWVDVMPKKGKASGAFAHPGSVDTHQYVLLNFMGKYHDVLTEAHELGHGIHQHLASKKGTLLSETPITLAEIASIFCENIVYEKIKQEADTDIKKIEITCMKLDGTMASLFRQISFFMFEKRAHKKRAAGVLSSGELSELWVETLKEYLGPYVNIDDCVASYWEYIQHFFHSPFYVYSYSFAEILVNALYDCYKNASKKDEFVEKYIKMLSQGGAERYDVAMKKFGLDTGSASFWKSSMKVFETQVDELENLCRVAEIC